jgi:hypothetical protein
VDVAINDFADNVRQYCHLIPSGQRDNYFVINSVPALTDSLLKAQGSIMRAKRSSNPQWAEYLSCA